MERTSLCAPVHVHLLLDQGSCRKTSKQHDAAGGMACVLVQADARRIFQMYNMPGGSEVN